MTSYTSRKLYDHMSNNVKGGKLFFTEGAYFTQQLLLRFCGRNVFAYFTHEVLNDLIEGLILFASFQQQSISQDINQVPGVPKNFPDLNC